MYEVTSPHLIKFLFFPLKWFSSSQGDDGKGREGGAVSDGIEKGEKGEAATELGRVLPSTKNVRNKPLEYPYKLIVGKRV